MKIFSLGTGLLFGLLVMACAAPTPTRVPPSPTLDAGRLVPRATPANAYDRLPAVATRQADLDKALSNNPPILALTDLDGERATAQVTALRDPRVAQLARTQDGTPLRTEVFGVVPLRDSDITQATAACSVSKCYRVELYNYALNLMIAAVADVTTQRVLAVNQYENTQPDPPPQLVDLAIDIARHAPQVQQALGYTPAQADAMMANTKTALKATQCERSQHFCLAPTFKQGDRALWAIVDLTDNVLVGTRWTYLGQLNGPAVTERSLQNDVVAAQFCDKQNSLVQGSWTMDYILTSSDGLRISNVKYKQEAVLESAKIVDWHVSYSYDEGFGYSDAIGCPVFSEAAVVAFGGPQVQDLVADGKRVGFVLIQDFFSEFWPLPCNYYYQQRYEFYDDGSFRIAAGNLGRGCGTEGTYRPVTRIEWGGPYSFAQWSNGNWQVWQTEQWALASDITPNADGMSFRIANGQGQGYAMRAGTRVPTATERGDNAFIFVTADHSGRDEGKSDLPTIGPCCNTDYQQGPEKFIDSPPENIENSRLVLWYVAQMRNDNTPGKEYCWANVVLSQGVPQPHAYPCYSGPLFVPIQK